jgi:hypothetical protein
MAKSIKKKTFSLEDLQGKYSTKAKYKEDSFFDVGEAFYKACGIPGPAEGHINVFLGHSDTGKTTALVRSAIDAQKKGKLPVFIITEQKWDFQHAKLMGFDCELNETGEWSGTFLFNDGFSYIEQITDYINELIDEQQKGNIPYDLVFFWDSVGSVPCKMTFEGKGGKMHNASTLADKIGMGINQRITGSRKESEKFTNTLIIVNQPWVELPDNPFSQPRIKMKGGEAIFLNSTLVFLFGNQKNSGISKINATKNGRKVAFATRTKVSILKNHVNGIGFSDGRVIVTPHSFINDDANDIKKYKESHSSYWVEQFEKAGEKVDDGSFELVESDV